MDDRAQAGIKQAQGAADTANQNAQNATTQPAMPTRRPTMWRIAPTRSTRVVKGLDNYKQMADVSVTFGFDKSC